MLVAAIVLGAIRPASPFDAVALLMLLGGLASFAVVGYRILRRRNGVVYSVLRTFWACLVELFKLP
jgi:hypothetical protein